MSKSDVVPSSMGGRAPEGGLRELLAEDVVMVMRHVSLCCCRYVASRSDTSDVKLIDTRCIARYLIAKEAEGAKDD